MGMNYLLGMLTSKKREIRLQITSFFNTEVVRISEKIKIPFPM